MTKHVLLISHMYFDPQRSTSTDIMLNNIIEGMLENGITLSLFLICAKGEENLAFQKYGERVSNIKLHLEKSSKEKGRFETLVNALASRMSCGYLTKEEYRWLRAQIKKETVIVSHSPAFDAVYISHKVKKGFDNRYIQYHSDPQALSGILPEQLSLKRFPYYLMEIEALSYADEIVFGTKTLYNFQKELYKKYAHKMRWADVAYCKKTEEPPEKPRTFNGVHLVYSGNYFSSIRDIMPLYEAVNESAENIRLSVYGSSNIDLESTEKVSVHGRVSHEEVVKVEDAADIMVCILNLNCIQIPGKVFYNTNSSQRILILVDGKYGDVIKEDLQAYQRFEFCENEKDAIIDWLKRNTSMPSAFTGTEHLEKLSPKSVSLGILNENCGD